MINKKKIKKKKKKYIGIKQVIHPNQEAILIKNKSFTQTKKPSSSRLRPTFMKSLIIIPRDHTSHFLVILFPFINSGEK
jgi:hypothetical protein